MSQLKIAQQLLTLCSDPANQSYIIKEAACLTGLVGYLSSTDVEVVRTASKAIWYLASGESNREVLKAAPGLLDKLCSLNSSSDEKVSVTVKETLSLLSHAKASDMEDISENSAPSERTPVAKRDKPRAITFKVEGIATEYWRALVERALISVPGVISVTLDQRREEAIIYTRAGDELVEKLQNALRSLGVDGEHMAAGNPSATPLPARNPFSTIQAPKYLDDEEEQAAYFGTGVMTANTANASLEARLAAKRKQQGATGGKREKVKRLFGAIGNGLGIW